MDFSFSSYAEGLHSKGDNSSLVQNERVPVLPPRSLSELGRYKISHQAKPKLLVPVAGLLVALLVLSMEEKIVDISIGQNWQAPIERIENSFAKKVTAIGNDLNFEQLVVQTANVSGQAGKVVEENLSKSQQGLENISTTVYHNWQNFNPGEKLAVMKVTVETQVDSYIAQTKIIANEIAFFLDAAEVQTAAVGINSLLDRNDVNFVTQTVVMLEETRLSVQNFHSRFNEKVGASSVVLASVIASTGELIIWGDRAMTMAYDKSDIIGQGVVGDFKLTSNVIDSYTNNVAQLINTADKNLMASAEFSAKGLQAAAISTREALRAVWYGVPMAIIRQMVEIKNSVVEAIVQLLDNWRRFLFGEEAGTGSVAPVGDLREQIRQDLINELQGQMDGVFDELRAGRPAVVRQPSVGENGVVVVPAGSSSANVKNQLQNMFSDPVTVRFDVDGQSGIITPQFKDRTGDNYVFLLTPVKK
ncbi:MAG: hypothetical protein QG665_532 [Patescibacteria group bacterium]|nr:hypothetical protein [Patescibacteria group bacterium]